MGFTIVEAHEPHGSSVLQFMSVNKLFFFKTKRYLGRRNKVQTANTTELNGHYSIISSFNEYDPFLKTPPHSKKLHSRHPWNVVPSVVNMKKIVKSKMYFLEQLVNIYLQISSKINMHVHHLWMMLQKIVYTYNLTYLK